MDLKVAVEKVKLRLERDRYIDGSDLDAEQLEAVETLLTFCQSVLEARGTGEV